MTFPFIALQFNPEQSQESASILSPTMKDTLTFWTWILSFQNPDYSNILNYFLFKVKYIYFYITILALLLRTGVASTFIFLCLLFFHLFLSNCRLASSSVESFYDKILICNRKLKKALNSEL